MASDLDCKFVLKLNSSIEQCNFVINNTDCQDASGYFNYVELLYCDFSDRQIFGLVLFGFWLVFLFVGLAVSADDFFCPNLDTMAKTLKLSHNIAGITIMALGNGAPDIFSSFASVSQARPELLLGELFGAGVFVTTFVAGSICLTKPFKLMERPFLRDVVFYLAAGFWAYYIFYRGKIFLFDAIGFLGLYLVYLLVVVIGRFVNQRMRRHAGEAERRLLGDEDDHSGDPTYSIFEASHVAEDPPPSIETVQPDDVYVQEIDPDLDNIGTVQESSETRGRCRSFFLALIPSELCDSSSTWYLRAWALVKFPYTVAFSLTIPIAALGIEGGDGEAAETFWSQYLHVIHCILSPQLVLFATGFEFFVINFSAQDKFRAWEITLAASLAVAVLFLCASSPSRAPGWRPLLSFFGFAVSVVWIYALANEVVSVLKVFGVALGFSDAILGLTLLAWGNSLSDLISDVAVARRGFPRMGFSACFGGPLFNLLLGVGLPFCYLFYKTGQAELSVDYNVMVTLLSASLGASLTFSFVFLPLAGFQAGRLYGTLLVVFYAVFLTVAVVIELSYGDVSLANLQALIKF